MMPRGADQLLLPVNPLFMWTTMLLAFAFNLVPSVLEALMGFGYRCG